MAPVRLSEQQPLAVETHENWLEAHRCLNMNDLREHKKAYPPQSRLKPANP